MGGPGGTCPPILSTTGARGAPSSPAPIGVRRACAPLDLPRGVAFVLSRVCHGSLAGHTYFAGAYWGAPNTRARKIRMARETSAMAGHQQRLLDCWVKILPKSPERRISYFGKI